MRADSAVPKLAYEHLILKLCAQQQYVTSLRNQAGISAAVTGLIGTFFGGLLSAGNGSIAGNWLFALSGAALSGIILFSASIAFSAMVVIHFANFTFSFDTQKMLEVAVWKTDAGFLKSYVKDGEWFFKDNEKLIEAAQTKLWFAMVFGFLQIIPWVFVIGTQNE